MFIKHAIESYEHLKELKEYAELNELCILGLGFDPISKLEDLTFIPKERYKIMSEYMPKVGSRLDMMNLNMQCSSNLDYFNETDLIKKFVVLIEFKSIVMGIFCNCPS